MATMTLEERERRAYADGDVEAAALLAAAIDTVDDRVEELEYQVGSLEQEVRRLETVLEDAAPA